MHLSILICTHNRSELLVQTLESLRSLKIPQDASFDLLVVANACTDDTVDVAEERFAKLPMPCRCVVESTPGLSRARNRAIQESKGSVLAFLDDDVLVDPDWGWAMADAFRNREIDIVGGWIELWWGEVSRPRWWDDRLDSMLSANKRGESPKELPTSTGVVGANFALRRTVVERVGLFDESLGRVTHNTAACEDTEIVERAQAARLNAWYWPAARVQHWVPAHRATWRHIAGMSYGRAVSRMRHREFESVWLWLRSVLGNAYYIVSGSLGALGALLLGNRALAVKRTLRICQGYGALQALLLPSFSP